MEKKEKEIEGLMSSLSTASRIVAEKIQQSNGEIQVKVTC